MPYGLPAIGVALFLLLLTYSALIFLKALINGFGDSVPVIGGYIKHALNSIVNAVIFTLNDWISEHIVTVIRFFGALAVRVAELPDAVADFAGRVTTTFDILYHQRIPDLVDAINAPLRRSIGSLDHALNHAIDVTFPDLVGTVTAPLARSIGALDQALGRAVHGIDRLRRDVFEDTIPAVQRGIGESIGAIGSEVGSLRDLLGDTRASLGRLARRAEDALPWVETVAATIGAAVAIEAIRRMVRCGSKIDRLCTTDEALLGDLLDTFVVLGAFIGLAELTRETANLLDLGKDAVRDLAS